MITALIGRFVLHCIEQTHQRRVSMVTRRVDLSQLTDRQISDVIHGRPIDLSQFPPLKRTGFSFNWSRRAGA